tara:strand:+ start:12652 stop:13419 length:768 start_codon:yes stop_codon:yes gene_type:complete
MATTGPIATRGNRRPQVVWTADHRLRTIGRQLEIEAGPAGYLGIIVTPKTSVKEAIGMLDKTGGRLFFTEGIWSFDGSLAIDTPDVHLLSTSPGKTVFRRPASSTTTTPLITVNQEGAIFDGIRIIDKSSGARHTISCDATRATIKNCVFEDVQKGVSISSTWCAVRDCTFLTSQGYAVEFTGTASNGMVTGNIIQDSGGSVYLGDNVSEVAVLTNVFENTDGGSVKISYMKDKEIVTGSALNVVHATQVEERCP